MIGNYFSTNVVFSSRIKLDRLYNAVVDRQCVLSVVCQSGDADVWNYGDEFR